MEEAAEIEETADETGTDVLLSVREEAGETGRRELSAWEDTDGRAEETADETTGAMEEAWLTGLLTGTLSGKTDNT